jgi:orotate phosphoribosyltransferase
MAADPALETFLSLVDGRRGHFRLESGHHGELWLELDGLFAEPRRIDPLVAALADRIAPLRVDAVCGPLLGGAFLAQAVAMRLGVMFCFTERVMPADREGLYPVRYPLPAAFRERLRGKRVAMVDDVMSAGSALRGTCQELLAHGAEPVAAGALLVMGEVGARHFAELGIPVLAAAHEAYRVWPPEACPLCAAGVPVEDVAPA